MPIEDSLIAATAAVHNLAVVARNHVDFANAGVRIVDPFVSGRCCVDLRPSSFRLELQICALAGFELLTYFKKTPRAVSRPRARNTRLKAGSGRYGRRSGMPALGRRMTEANLRLLDSSDLARIVDTSRLNGRNLHRHVDVSSRRRWNRGASRISRSRVICLGPRPGEELSFAFRIKTSCVANALHPKIAPPGHGIYDLLIGMALCRDGGLLRLEFVTIFRTA
jgi:hypothetical protein